MSRIRKTLIAAGAVCLALAACSGNSNTTGSSSNGASGGSGSKVIYLVSKGFQHQFWQSVKQGAEQAGKELGYEVKFVGPDDETKVAQQLDQLQAALTSKPAAIGFAALDSKAAVGVLNQVKAAKIPVVAFDSGVDSDIPVATVSTDNKAAAAEAAKRLAGLMDMKGTVGFICHDQTSATGKQRCDGFQEWMKTNAPNIKLLEPQIANKIEDAAGKAKAMLTANPEISGMYGTNEGSATGLVKGVMEAGFSGKVKVVGFDSGKTQIDAINSGTQAGAVTQSPVKMGYKTVEAAVKSIKGEAVEKNIDSGFAWYDKSNMESADIKPNLYS